LYYVVLHAQCTIVLSASSCTSHRTHSVSTKKVVFLPQHMRTTAHWQSFQMVQDSKTHTHTHTHTTGRLLLLLLWQAIIKFMLYSTVFHWLSLNSYS